jgi:phosphatidylserine decarboxylase
MERLKVWLQFALPQHTLSRIVYAATRIRWSPWKDLLIRWFIRRYDVQMADALVTEPTAYEHFNAFFTRALRAGARPLPENTDLLVSPVDGSISRMGLLEDETLLQAKGRPYTLTALLGGDADLAGEFRGGTYATLYLSPRDYHRIHMPVDGTLREMMYLPGRLFAVNPATVRAVDQLFARNERVVCLFDTKYGPLAIIMVGAIFVGSMETVWAGPVTPSAARSMRRWTYAAGKYRFRRGEEIARFNMGSTVIVLTARGCLRWHAHWQEGMPLRQGSALGSMVSL